VFQVNLVTIERRLIPWPLGERNRWQELSSTAWGSQLGGSALRAEAHGVEEARCFPHRVQGWR
jgi:hypothetical protein